MAEQQNQQNRPEFEPVSRRRLLQIIVATGGAVVATVLVPRKWAKPVVETGVLPAHAQVSEPTVEPTSPPIPTAYRIDCASTPNGGTLVWGDGAICIDVAALLVLTSGTGPVAGVTMELDCDTPFLFAETFPLQAVTDAAGLADFGQLCIDTEFQEGTQFTFSFSCTDPVNGGTLTGSCLTYTLSWGNPQ